MHSSLSLSQFGDRLLRRLQPLAEGVFLVACLAGILLTRLYSYLLFHSLVELFSIVVAFGVFILAWNSDTLVKNGYLLLVGIGSLFVAVIDALHTLAFAGMGVFAIPGANLPTQLWVVARYLQAITWLVAPFLIWRKLNRFGLTTLFTVATACLLLSIFVWKSFPTAYVDGLGLTPFKRISEYVIIAMLLAALALTWRRRAQFDPVVLSWLTGSLLAAVACEFAFTLYFGVTDTANLLGHVFKIGEFYCLYRALVEIGFTRPYGLVLRQIKIDDDKLVAMEKGVADARTAELDAIFSTMTDGAILYGLDGAILRKNDAADQLFGYTQVSPDLPMKSRIKLHNLLDEGGQPVDRTEDLPTPRALRGEEVHDQVLGAPDPETGEIRWLAFSAAPVRDLSGGVIGAVVTFRDISDRKHAEEEIRWLNQELERRVRDRTGRMHDVTHELESFAYSISHDLWAPLHRIDALVETLQKRAAESIDEPGRLCLDSISDSSHQMGKLLDDLLVFSHLSHVSMLTLPVDLSDLVQIAIGDLQSEAAGREIEWAIAPLPCVLGDRATLQIALHNLISNALKFTRPRRKARIEIGCFNDDLRETVIFVHDNGVGFDMEQAAHLFGVFQRLHSVEDYEGTGIGLATVRRIISRHGGRTWANARVDGGATFYFSLPLAITPEHEEA